MKKYGGWLSVACAALICLLTMGVYLQNTLGGNLDFHFLPAKAFGVPTALTKKGIEPLYLGKELGWDGQFYFYMANDLLAVADTPQHIDRPSYRYQRIGLSLYTAAVAKLTGQDWVSPLTYYLSYLGLILAGVWAACRCMTLRGGWPLAGLVWVAGAGTQVTLLNGLPDAAADAFLILATLALLQSRRWIGGLLLALAALSRESYIVFPAAYLTWLMWEQLKGVPVREWPSAAGNAFAKIQPAFLLFPIGVFMVWQFYVRQRFGIAPTEEAKGILGAPFYEWWVALRTGLSGHHYLVAAGMPSYWEGISQICFMVLLLITLMCASMVLWRREEKPQWVCALAVGAIVLALLYICFGRIVAMHYTGYMKAANLFVFLIPVFMAELGLRGYFRYLVYVVVVTSVALTTTYLWTDRILPSTQAGNARYLRMGEVSRTQEAPCLARFDATVRLVGREDGKAHNVLSILSGSRSEVLWVELTNRSGEPFVALHGKGAVNMSYSWLTEDGRTVVREGIRSMIPEGLADGASARVPVVVEFPPAPGRYILRLTPVQEGCAWFYLANPASAQDLLFTLR